MKLSLQDHPSCLGSFPFPKSYGQPYWCLPLCSEIAATFRLFTSSDAPTLFFLSRGNIFPIFEPNLLLKSFTGERIWAKGLRVALTFSQSIGCTCTCFTAPLFAHSEALGRLLYFGDISSLITLSVRPHDWPHGQPHDQPCPFHLGIPLCQSSPSSLLETRIVFADDTRVALSPYQPWEWVHFLQFTHHYTSDKLHIVNMQIGSTTSWRWRWCWLWRQKPVIMGSRWVVMGIEDPRRGLGPKPLITRWKLTKWRGSKWGDKAPHSLLNRNCINILHSIECSVKSRKLRYFEMAWNRICHTMAINPFHPKYIHTSMVRNLYQNNANTFLVV